MNAHSFRVFFSRWYHVIDVRSIVDGWGYLLVGLAIAILLVVLNPKSVWTKVRPFVTWLHEGGHATAALMLSGKVRSITLRKDTSGLTTCAVSAGRGPFKNARSGMVALAGTPAPMVVGAGIGLGLVYGYAHLVLVVLGVMAVLTILRLRNWWGLLVLLGVAASLALSWIGGPVVAGIVLGVMAGVGLLGGLKTVFEGHRPRPERDGTGDAEAAAKALHLPVTWMEALWVVIWVLCITSLGVGVFYAG